ncbi:hypothetical protein TSMEX_000397, partial [Taenia solium]
MEEIKCASATVCALFGTGAPDRLNGRACSNEVREPKECNEE